MHRPPIVTGCRAMYTEMVRGTVRLAGRGIAIAGFNSDATMSVPAPQHRARVHGSRAARGALVASFAGRASCPCAWFGRAPPARGHIVRVRRRPRHRQDRAARGAWFVGRWPVHRGKLHRSWSSAGCKAVSASLMARARGLHRLWPKGRACGSRACSIAHGPQYVPVSRFRIAHGVERPVARRAPHRAMARVSLPHRSWPQGRLQASLVGLHCARVDRAASPWPSAAVAASGPHRICSIVYGRAVPAVGIVRAEIAAVIARRVCGSPYGSASGPRGLHRSWPRPPGRGRPMDRSSEPAPPAASLAHGRGSKASARPDRPKGIASGTPSAWTGRCS
ncbi:hypothetical protein NL676_007041 [Syzygium grande]|nr:hypothetical protein NL676_007041 [Syzygium grande]